MLRAALRSVFHGFGCFHDGGETSICMWKDDVPDGLTALYRKDGRLERWYFIFQRGFERSSWMWITRMRCRLTQATTLVC